MSAPNSILPISIFIFMAIIYYIFRFFKILSKTNSIEDKSMHDLDKYALSFLKNTNFYSIYDIIIFICVFLAIIMSQYFFTLNNSRLLCGSIQPLYCVYNILISWGIFLLIFSLANKFWLKTLFKYFWILIFIFFYEST